MLVHPPLVDTSFLVSERHLDQYRIEGWVQLPQLLSPHGLAVAREACDTHVSSLQGNGHPWLVAVTPGTSWLADLLCEQQLRPLLHLFCGAQPCLAGAQFFVKTPHSSGQRVGWHQDGTQDTELQLMEEPGGERLGEPSRLNLWIPLDPVAPELDNGALRVIPRMHRY